MLDSFSATAKRSTPARVDALVAIDAAGVILPRR